MEQGKSMSRQLSGKDLAYESIASEWADVISNFDTKRRMDVLLDQLTPKDAITGKRALEVGCGLGEFSRQIAARRPASFTAVDLAPTLVRRLAKRLPEADCRVADALDLSATLGNSRYDFILSSEVIEHTPDPRRAVAQMARHLAPGGYLVLSVPNRRWRWLLTLATRAGARKHYQGYENWVRPGELLAWLDEEGLQVTGRSGVHTVPWHLSKALTAGLDRILGPANYTVAVNLAIVATKPSE
jgi:2-polyprenyl-3-methyl-5-hydroxy-6-metoxy-1,4-benzoquinol methylase